jgi:thiamine biosynthesis lipoprotein
MQQISFDIIWTHLDISIDTDQSIEIISQKIQWRIHDFEQKFSRFIEGNWLHDLNLQRKWILDQDGLNMLNKMLEIAKNTDGYFDPTIWKKLTELWYGNQKTNLKSHRDTEYGNYQDIEMKDDCVILHKNIELEFGGIGKWYLIDLIYSELQEFPRFLINFGGDMYGRGSWNIWLESPFASDEVIGTIILDNTFLACSAGTKRKWGDHHHLIDPHTGESARDVIASYIEWESGMITDGYATALCVMPWKLACETLEKTPEISGVLVSKEGGIYQKEGSSAEIFE